MCEIAKQSGAFDAVPCNHWSAGGRGAVKLAQAVEKAASQKNSFKYLYSLEVRFLFVCFLVKACCISVGIKTRRTLQQSYLAYLGRGLSLLKITKARENKQSGLSNQRSRILAGNAHYLVH